MIRRHRPFVVLLTVGVVLRVLVMIGYRPAIFYVDSFASYLSVLTTLNPTGEDPIGYVVLMLKPALAVGNFTFLVTVQHLLGLGMGVAGYLLLRRKGAGRWLAALAVAPVLLDAYQVQIEHNVMADPLFEALLVAALVTLAWPDRPGWVGVIVFMAPPRLDYTASGPGRRTRGRVHIMARRPATEIRCRPMRPSPSPANPPGRLPIRCLRGDSP